MSLTRRLQRIIRAHLGSLRESADNEAREGSSRYQSAGAASTTSASEESGPTVPPEVAQAYRALEVPVGSDRETVKNAYRRLMKKYHQDRFENDDDKREVAGTVSKRLNRAYERVTDYLDNASS